MNLEKETFTLITNQFGDKYFHEVNGSAFNRVGSETLYKKYFDEKLWKKNTLYIILGTDSGLLPKYLDGVGLPEGARYLFVEIPEILDLLLPLIPDEGLDENIILTTPDEWVAEAEALGLTNYIFLGRLEFFYSVGAEDLHIGEYQKCGSQLREQLDQIRWTALASIGSDIFNIRQLQNLAENRISAVCLEGVFKGKTAVILGGGPSLDASLPWIVRNRDNLAVFAVSRIARRLLEVGLTPDVFLSIDPYQWSFDISKEMLLIWEHTIFVHQFHVSSKLLGQYPGRHLFLGPRFCWTSPYNDDQLVGSGPTVTNCAIDLAVQMGFSRLLFAGIDLCFSREGFTHARGSNEHKAGPQLGYGKLWVETNSGEMAETTPDLNFALSTIAGQAEIAKKKNCRFYNLGADAAGIPGVEYCAPDSMAVEPLSVPACDILAQSLPVENAFVRVEYLTGILTELERADTAFRQIGSLSEEALEANDFFSGRLGDEKGHPKYRERIDEIEACLNNDYPDFIRLVKYTGIRNLLTVAYDGQGQGDWDEADVERLMRGYYEAYRNSAKRLLKLVDSTRGRIISRLEEEKERPDFNVLIDQWKTDGQPGRAMVWKTHHEDVDIPESFLPTFKKLEEDFKAVLAEKETSHMARSKRFSELGPVCGKLKLMFKHGERESLERLLVGLEKVDDPEARALFYLGNGFLAELAEDPGSALSEYNQVIDLMMEEMTGNALEEALVRVFVISIDRNDTENALLASNCLTSISPAYLPYYADLLRLTGDKMGALEVYTDYLEKTENDIPVMLKLGRLYVELGSTQGARVLFESLLQKDPGNKAALQLLSSLDDGPIDSGKEETPQS